MYESPRAKLLISASETVMTDDVMSSDENGDVDNTVNVEDLVVKLENP